LKAPDHSRRSASSGSSRRATLDRAARGMLLAAALLLIASYFLPLWRIDVISPASFTQFGLAVHAYRKSEIEILLGAYVELRLGREEVLPQGYAALCELSISRSTIRREMRRIKRTNGPTLASSAGSAFAKSHRLRRLAFRSRGASGVAAMFQAPVPVA
jgi:hypothetical protein